MNQKKTIQEQQVEYFAKLRAAEKEVNKGNWKYYLLSVVLLYLFIHGLWLATDTIVDFLFVVKWSFILLISLLILLKLFVKNSFLALFQGNFESLQGGFVICFFILIMLGMTMLWGNYLPFSKNYQKETVKVEEWSLIKDKRGRQYATAKIEYLGHHKRFTFYQFNTKPQNINSIVIEVRRGNLGWGIIKDYYIK